MGLDLKLSYTFGIKVDTKGKHDEDDNPHWTYDFSGSMCHRLRASQLL